MSSWIPLLDLTSLDLTSLDLDIRLTSLTFSTIAYNVTFHWTDDETSWNVVGTNILELFGYDAIVTLSTADTGAKTQIQVLQEMGFTEGN